MSAKGLGVASVNPAKPFLEGQQLYMGFLKNASGYNSTQLKQQLICSIEALCLASIKSNRWLLNYL